MFGWTLWSEPENTKCCFGCTQQLDQNSQNLLKDTYALFNFQDCGNLMFVLSHYKTILLQASAKTQDRPLGTLMKNEQLTVTSVNSQNICKKRSTLSQSNNVAIF